MQIKLDGNKDVVTVEVYQKTDTASLSIWEFGGQTKIAVDTGSDGNFKVKFLLNKELEEIDKTKIYKSVKGIKIETAGKWCMGEFDRLSNEQEAINRNYLDVVEITPGSYVVDVYSLLIKDTEGKPKYLEFVYLVTPEPKYKGELYSGETDNLDLKYTD